MTADATHFPPEIWTNVSLGHPETNPPTTGVWIVAQTASGEFKRLRYIRAQGAWLTLNGTSTTILDVVRWRWLTLRKRGAAKADRRPWRTSAQIRGYRAQLVAAINASEDGAYAQLDLRTARALVDICLQAEHTEEGHGL